jgi:hypothetical protein
MIDIGIHFDYLIRNLNKIYFILLAGDGAQRKCQDFSKNSAGSFVKLHSGLSLVSAVYHPLQFDNSNLLLEL